MDYLMDVIVKRKIYPRVLYLHVVHSDEFQVGLPELCVHVEVVGRVLPDLHELALHLREVHGQPVRRLVGVTRHLEDKKGTLSLGPYICAAAAQLTDLTSLLSAGRLWKGPPLRLGRRSALMINGEEACRDRDV